MAELRGKGQCSDTFPALELGKESFPLTFSKF